MTANSLESKGMQLMLTIITSKSPHISRSACWYAGSPRPNTSMITSISVCSVKTLSQK